MIDSNCCRCQATLTDGGYQPRRDGLICKSCADKEMIYLATPYSHKNPVIRGIRFKQACIIAGQLIQEHHRVFSPIIACHPIGQYFDLPYDHVYWQRVDEIFMSMCTIIYVIKYSGWDNSNGIASEIDLAIKRGLPVFYVEIPNALIEENTNG